MSEPAWILTNGTDFWYTFANENIGDESPADGLNIDSSTPYTTIAGAGDGSYDRYSFEITEAMLSPSPDGFDPTNSSVPSGKIWLQQASIPMNGTAVSGQLLNTTLVVNKPGVISHETIGIVNYPIDHNVSLRKTSRTPSIRRQGSEIG